MGLVPLRERNLDSVLRGRGRDSKYAIFYKKQINDFPRELTPGVEKCSRTIQRGIHIPVLLKRSWQRAPQGSVPSCRASAEKCGTLAGRDGATRSRRRPPVVGGPRTVHHRGDRSGGRLRRYGTERHALPRQHRCERARIRSAAFHGIWIIGRKCAHQTTPALRRRGARRARESRSLSAFGDCIRRRHAGGPR